MHSLSYATGESFGMLLEQRGRAYPGLAREVARHADRARTQLALTNDMVSATMMIAQLLLVHDEWENPWRFTFAVALSLGCKMVTEGFYTSDVSEQGSFGTDWDARTLTAGELAALRILIPGGSLGGNVQHFRDALMRVALNAPPPFKMTIDDGEPFNVLIVERSHPTTAMHRDFVLLTRPSATVVAVNTVEEAIAHLRTSERAGVQVQLVLTDFDLDPDGPDGERNPQLERMLVRPNGFDVVNELAVIDEAQIPRISFCFKPYVAMVTDMSQQLMAIAEQVGHDAGWPDQLLTPAGHVIGCNSLIPKPLTLEMVRVLVEGTVL